MTSKLEEISNLFGSYKAEWLSDSLYELYTEPSYYPELKTLRPCALIGGRGTGKTTVLKALSYQGQLEFIKRNNPKLDDKDNWKKFGEQNFIGFYYKASTPRVTAFKGGGVEEEIWSKIFKHYINLVFSQKVFSFIKSYIAVSDTNEFADSEIYKKLSRVLALKQCHSIEEMHIEVENALLSIEIYINNIGIEDLPRLSTSGALETVFHELCKFDFFNKKTFVLIIDEYENFLDFQQQIINTLIKHITPNFTFKIGARHLGWRVKATESEDEFLHHPSDYVLINISESLKENKFAEFAENVCNARLRAVLEDDEVNSVKELFPSLSTDKEAELLGVVPLAQELRNIIKKTKNKEWIKRSSSLSDLDLYVVDLFAQGQNSDFIEVFSSMEKDENGWISRLNEYRYSALFNIRKSKSGLKKYYAGWHVYLKLCGGNIRFLMELVEKAIRLHAENDEIKLTPISYSCQTEAAISVGKKNLEELSGLSTYGSKLTKLTLALGRIFGLLASDTAGHSFEVNQFRLGARNSEKYSSVDDWLLRADSNISKILRASVMHLALITFPGNKPKGEGDLKDDTYQLHPIFAPFFYFSHRRRRNLILYEHEIAELIEAPSKAIKSIVNRNNRQYVNEFPAQMKLFEEFFND